MFMGEYLAALWIHWVALMSGVIGLLIGVGLRVGRRLSETIRHWSDLPDWIFICIGIVCLFFAGYFTWQDKNEALIALQEKLKAPTFNAQVATVFIGYRGNQPLVIISGIISNPAGPASSIIAWRISVEFPNGEKERGIIPAQDEKDLKIPIPGSVPPNAVIFKASDYWPKTSQTPIAAGGALVGWCSAVFPNLDMEKAYEEHALIVVEVEDAVANKIHRFSTKFIKAGINLPPIKY
jgi:hypothetical protein